MQQAVRYSLYMRKKQLLVVLIIIVVAAAIVVWVRSTASAPSGSQATTNANQHRLTPIAYDKHQYSTAAPTSIWVVVNKQHALDPADYIPSDLVFPDIPLRVPGNESMQVRKVTATALQVMFAAAKTQGINLMLSSGYRSYNYQVNLYNGYVQSEGQAVADTQSARPGYSEHQTGLAADLEPASKTCEVDQCFANTAEGKWLAANAYKYGFIIRYPKDLDAITGYEYEPWHVRYVGTSLSTEMHKEGVQTLEQFFGIAGGTSYEQ